MIKNERQYRITKAQAARLEHALAELSNPSKKEESIHPLLLKAEKEGINSQLDDLRTEIIEYEELRAGKYEVPALDTLAEFPLILIKARIAEGLTQKELAEKLGLKEQQIQKYESTEYGSASLSRIREVAEALGVKLSDESIIRPSRTSLADLINRLREAGLDRDLVMKRIIPATLLEQASVTGGANDGLVYQIARHVGRIFGWTPSDILSESGVPLGMNLAGAKLKVAVNANEKRVNAYLIYAHYLALTLVPFMKNQKQEVLPDGPDGPYELRRAILDNYGSLTLANVINYLWDLGILVLPLNNPGGFQGAYFRENFRHMIVLKQKTSSASRWMFDALHEAYHSLQEPRQPNLIVVEHDDMSRERLSPDEVIASQYAGAVLLGKDPNQLAGKCIQEAKGDLRFLKSAVRKVAAIEKIPVDSLANYIAFRVSMNGQNWWGAAGNLQNVGQNPFSIAKDILLERVDLARLADPDLKLVERALVE